MIPASYYQPLYFLMITILTLICLGRYNNHPSSRLNDESSDSAFPFWLVILLIIFIGLRPISERYFVDMASYALYYSFVEGDIFNFEWDTYNVVFDNLLRYFASNSISVEIFFLLLASIYFICIAWSCALLFPKDKTASFLVYLGAFSTFSYGTNGIKAGAAASLFLVAIAFYKNRKLLLALLFMILSLGFHHSMILPLAAFVACVIIKNPKWYFAFWLFCLLIAILHITAFQELFALYSDERGALYLMSEGEHIRRDILGGFRIDFVLYSSVPIVFGLYSIYKKKFVSKDYCLLLNLYILTNSIWMLCMYAEFTNRIAYLSWFIYPIVLIYPFVKVERSDKQYSFFKKVAIGNLLFTLFMYFIYYA